VRLFNRLIEFFVNISFAHEFNTSTNSKRLAYEIYRAIGSLIYQNGPKLNENNLNRLLVQNESGNKSSDLPLSIKIRTQLESELEEHFRKNNSDTNEDVELLKRLDLISTQLIYNLTIPSVVSSLNSIGSATVNSGSETTFAYINEKYKAKCSNYLLKILKFHHMNKQFVDMNSNLILSSEDYKINKSKILSKALQGMENLFNSIKTSSLQSVEFNWLKIDKTNQIGDILAIIKVKKVYFHLKNLIINVLFFFKGSFFLW
jgi:hypothetical protein